MIAKPCCGSCDKFFDVEKGLWCMKETGYVFQNEYYINIDSCYSPRKPIKSKHEKMLEDLSSICHGFLFKAKRDELEFDKITIHISRFRQSIKKIEEKHND